MPLPRRSHGLSQTRPVKQHLASALNVVSLNVNVLTHYIKRTKVWSYLKATHLDVALLQETHLTDKKSEKLRHDWVGREYHAHKQRDAHQTQQSLNPPTKRWCGHSTKKRPAGSNTPNMAGPGRVLRITQIVNTGSDTHHRFNLLSGEQQATHLPTNFSNPHTISTHENSIRG